MRSSTVFSLQNKSCAASRCFAALLNNRTKEATTQVCVLANSFCQEVTGSDHVPSQPLDVITAFAVPNLDNFHKKSSIYSGLVAF